MHCILKRHDHSMYVCFMACLFARMCFCVNWFSSGGGYLTARLLSCRRLRLFGTFLGSVVGTRS